MGAITHGMTEEELQRDWESYKDVLESELRASLKDTSLLGLFAAPLILATLLVAGFVWLGWVASPYWLPLINNAPVISTTVVACIAIGLFRLRKNKPVLYGSIEVIVAVATVYCAVAQLSFDLQHMLPLMAAIYIMVRGFDNMSKGVRPATASFRWWQRVFGN